VRDADRAPATLEGRWTGSLRDDQRGTMALELAISPRPGGKSAAWQFESRLTWADEGLLSTDPGVWRTTSNVQPAQKGTYEFADDGSANDVSGPLGKGLWKKENGTP
jgi:hypothetical protein